MITITEKLGDIAKYFDKERLAVRCQLEYVGEAIESEFQKLREDLEKGVCSLNNRLSATINTQDLCDKAMADKIEELGRCNDQAHERLHLHSGRLEALKKIHPFSLQDHRHTEKEFQEGPLSLENLQNHLERLEEDLKKLKLDAFLETMPPEPMPPDPPTDKDGKPQFQVGDTIAFCDGSMVSCLPRRIVLEINPDTSKMKLMNVPSGRIQTECPPENYVFIYRPESPKSMPTVKDEVPTDKDGNPPGGLKQGDVFEYNSPCYAKRIEAIFIQQTPEQRWHDWIEGCRVCDGKIIIADAKVDDWKFKFRPKFPEPKDC